MTRSGQEGKNYKLRKGQREGAFFDGRVIVGDYCYKVIIQNFLRMEQNLLNCGTFSGLQTDIGNGEKQRKNNRIKWFGCWFGENAWQCLD